MTEDKALSGYPRGAIPFAPEGWRFIIPAAGLTVIARKCENASDEDSYYAEA